ncbi:hypothetical protein [Nocardia arthritidis]|uniref:Uncharacterized protein n=1 Tax=Nocardia arthritidis TaxID=228602 RepID=A0A6G9YLE1_9NOCA|nr:hypothetical protein [Nocardia arthritidis]QIS13960.1 hypothetical protein F5544_30585 [Nocardia arthritidis]
MSSGLSQSKQAIYGGDRYGFLRGGSEATVCRRHAATFLLASICDGRFDKQHILY